MRSIFLPCFFIVASLNWGFSQSVTIGSQVWMTKNLDVEKFQNGDPIPHAKTAEEWSEAANTKQPAWCYYDNDPANGEKYGKLYNWYALTDPRGLAPEGYIIPTDDDWTALTDYLGGQSIAGKKMKSEIGWKENGNGTNITNFSGLPGGFRNFNGYFNNLGYAGYWWSSTEFDTLIAMYRLLDYADVNVFRSGDIMGDGHSVRCIEFQIPIVYDVDGLPIVPELTELTDEPEIVWDAMTTETEPTEPEIYHTYVDEDPEFPGGYAAMMDFISKNLVYPDSAVKQGIQGRCYIKITVEADGKISGAQIERGIAGCPECDKEAVRVVLLMPKWKPGKIEGESVPVWYRIPFSFILEE